MACLSTKLRPKRRLPCKARSESKERRELTRKRVTGAFPTASTINVTLLHIYTNRRMLRMLVREIDSAIADSRLSTPAVHAELAKLPYLQACVYESLRCFPPITQLRERVVPAGGDFLDGRFVPAGTKIGLNTRGLERHKCFGPNPEIFRPERWMEADAQATAEMHKIHGLIFGYGSTKCLGVNQALMVITKSLVEVSYLAPSMNAPS